jgi:hypothetical protein
MHGDASRALISLYFFKLILTAELTMRGPPLERLQDDVVLFSSP